MRFLPAVLSLFLVLSVTARAQDSTKYNLNTVIYSDSAFYGKGSNVYLLNDQFAFRFTDTTDRYIQIVDLSKFKFFNITLDETLNESYVNLTSKGGEDSMHLIIFKAEMEGYGPIGFTMICYTSKPQIYSVAFGTKENFIIIRLKPHVYWKGVK
jgi:hypothetical protein